MTFSWNSEDLLVMQALWERGYTVIDDALSQATCQGFRDEILSLRASGLLHLNSTHLVKGSTRTLLQKHGIFEAEVAEKVYLTLSCTAHFCRS